jgi:hypothetical protein
MDLLVAKSTHLYQYGRGRLQHASLRGIHKAAQW